MHQDVDGCLRYHLIEAVGTTTPIAFVNMPSPVVADGGTWLQMFHMSSDRNIATLGDKGEDGVTGYIQIDVMTPIGHGTASAKALLDKIAKRFCPGAHLVYNETPAVRVTQTAIAAGFNSGGWWKTPCTVYYETRIRR